MKKSLQNKIYIIGPKCRDLLVEDLLRAERKLRDAVGSGGKTVVVFGAGYCIDDDLIKEIEGSGFIVRREFELSGKGETVKEFNLYDIEDKLEELITFLYELREDLRELGDKAEDLALSLDEYRVMAEDIAADLTRLEGIFDNPETEFDVE